jgi:hypothetical protein
VNESKDTDQLPPEPVQTATRADADLEVRVTASVTVRLILLFSLVPTVLVIWQLTH